MREGIAEDRQRQLEERQRQQTPTYEQVLQQYPGVRRMYESAIQRGRPAPTFQLLTWTKVPVETPQPQDATTKYGDTASGGGASEFSQKPLRTDVGLALKVYPTVKAVVEGVGQDIQQIGEDFWTTTRYGEPLSESVSRKEWESFTPERQAEIKQATMRTNILFISTIASIGVPALIPAKLAGSVALGLGVKTLAVSGIGAGLGYYQGGPEGAVKGAILAGGLYLAGVGLSKGVRTLYNYARPPPKPIAVGLVDVPDIGYVAPRTMSEKVLGLPQLEAPYQLRGLQPLAAEQTAWELATAPKTAALDPLLKSVTDETLLTRQLFGIPIGHPASYIPIVSRSVKVSSVPELLFGSGVALGLGLTLKNETVQESASETIQRQTPQQTMKAVTTLIAPQKTAQKTAYVNPLRQQFQYPRINHPDTPSLFRLPLPKHTQKVKPFPRGRVFRGWPIASPDQTANFLMGNTRRKRK